LDEANSKYVGSKLGRLVEVDLNSNADVAQAQNYRQDRATSLVDRRQPDNRR
jgi:hypothetical protein